VTAVAGYLHVIDVVELGRRGFDQVRELTGMWPCSPASLEHLPVAAPEDIERAAARMLEKIREHGEPVKLLVPCEGLRSWPYGGSSHAVARYGDLYCERVSGLSCGSNAGGALALLRMLERYMGLDGVRSDADTGRESGFVIDPEYRHAAMLVELCQGKAWVTIYKLEPPEPAQQG